MMLYLDFVNNPLPYILILALTKFRHIIVHPILNAFIRRVCLL